MSQTSHSSNTSNNTDTEMVNAIVQTLKSRGIFDEFRRECLSDVDTKPSFQNLLQRVDGYVSRFLSEQKWHQLLNKNHLRERLRTQLNESGMLKFGIEHLAEQVVSFKMNSLFYSKIESVVKEFLGIKEIPLNQCNDSYVKTNAYKDSPVIKTEENVEIKVQNIKVEPKEEKMIEVLQPMEIETDSNHSIESKVSKDIIENSLCAGDSDNGYVDWPTPPQPEMLTPERNELKCSPIKEQDIKESIKSNDESNTKLVVVKEENLKNTFTHEIKENETFLFSNVKKEEKVSDIDIVEENTNDEDHDLSDVSSVHTSDLSDFDDEISLDDSNDELKDSKKKKISLKVVKKITAVLSNEQIKDRDDKQNIKIQNESNDEKEIDQKVLKKVFKSESKRIRKVNPKYASEEFSSIFSEKDRIQTASSKDETEEESENSNNMSANERRKQFRSTESHSSDQKLCVKKRRHSNSSDIDLSSNKSSKLNKRIEEIPFETRSSSRASAESSLSETTQDSTTSQTRPHRRKVNKNRNESQTQQRYSASDLYKPRPHFSSRRTRLPTTPDSNTQSNDDFVIHDLSK